MGNSDLIGGPHQEALRASQERRASVLREEVRPANVAAHGPGVLVPGLIHDAGLAHATVRRRGDEPGA
jgi:hypothetical protein